MSEESNNLRQPRRPEVGDRIRALAEQVADAGVRHLLDAAGKLWDHNQAKAAAKKWRPARVRMKKKNCRDCDESGGRIYRGVEPEEP